MNVRLNRFYADDDMTLGLLFIDKQFQCFTLEDEKRMVKIPGETRIPAGTYQIVFNENESPKTLEYRKRFSFFKYHLMLKDVKGFEWIYIHPGNNDDQTEGCILVGYKANKGGELERSVPAYMALYGRVQEAIQAGDSVNITVTDEE